MIKKSVSKISSFTVFTVHGFKFQVSSFKFQVNLEPWNSGTLEPWNLGTLEPKIWNPKSGTQNLEPRNPELETQFFFLIYIYFLSNQIVLNNL